MKLVNLKPLKRVLQSRYHLNELRGEEKEMKARNPYWVYGEERGEHEEERVSQCERLDTGSKKEVSQFGCLRRATLYELAPPEISP